MKLKLAIPALPLVGLALTVTLAGCRPEAHTAKNGAIDHGAIAQSIPTIKDVIGNDHKCTLIVPGKKKIVVDRSSICVHAKPGRKVAIYADGYVRIEYPVSANVEANTTRTSFRSDGKYCDVELKDHNGIVYAETHSKTDCAGAYQKGNAVTVKVWTP
jgi:hypothetical protein